MLMALIKIIYVDLIFLLFKLHLLKPNMKSSQSESISLFIYNALLINSLQICIRNCLFHQIKLRN